MSKSGEAGGEKIARVKAKADEKLAREIATTNEGLRALNCRVRILRKNNSLYLRAPIPPRPSSAATKDPRKEIPINCMANMAGLKRAKDLALEINQLLEERKFT